MKHAIIIVATLLQSLLAIVSAVAVPVDIEAERPNIIFVMADDLGWGDVGFNGNTVIKTPQLDAMAKDGMRLTRFYTASPLCSPTRGSCLTGRYPWRFGVLAAHTSGMRMAEMTVAEVAHLKKYQTGFFGKWHLGWVKPEERLPRGFYSPPWQHGFDESFATTGAVPTWNPSITPAGEISDEDGDAGAPAQEGAPWKGGKPYVHNSVEVGDNMAGDDSRVIMDRVIPFIRMAAEQKQPFLACVWFHTPHEPVVAGPEYCKLYAKHGTAKQNYYGAITAMDEQIGRLRTELRQLGIAGNTIIFFTSDNGPADAAAKKGIASAGPFRGHKHTMYDGGLRVPSLVEWPGHITAGNQPRRTECRPSRDRHRCLDPPSSPTVAKANRHPARQRLLDDDARPGNLPSVFDDLRGTSRGNHTVGEYLSNRFDDGVCRLRHESES